jgi:hypothetical protein
VLSLDISALTVENVALAVKNAREPQPVKFEPLEKTE